MTFGIDLLGIVGNIATGVTANKISSMLDGEKLPFEAMIMDSIKKSINSHIEAQLPLQRPIYTHIKEVIYASSQSVYLIYAKNIPANYQFQTPLPEASIKAISHELLKTLNRETPDYKKALHSILGQSHLYHIENLGAYDQRAAFLLLFNIARDGLKEKREDSSFFSLLYNQTSQALVEMKPSTLQITPSFTEAIEALDTKIKEVTAEQFELLKKTRKTRRCRFSGCAGSGKTIVATEKAIQMDEAGMEVLLLCYSPRLAEKLKKYTQKTTVTVMNFSEWLQDMAGTRSTMPSDWSHSHEPTEDLIHAAFDATVKDSYDAIIVDEGQDFQSHWWDVVSSRLKSETDSFLYIFYDDQQRLLERDLEFPVEQWDKRLSKNCRNGGNIFELIQSFHPTTQPDIRLENLGHLDFRPYNGEIETSIAPLLNQMHNDQLDDLIVLTTEEGSAHDSLLADAKITLVPYSWQEFVIEYARPARSQAAGCPAHTVHPMHPRDNMEQLIANSKLSCEPLPTLNDIEIVKEMVSGQLNSGVPLHTSSDIHIKLEQNSLRLSGARNSTQTRFFFASGEWAKRLPAPRVITFKANAIPHKESKNTPLYTVDSFKGLEHDNILLFAPHVDRGTEVKMYIGASRAKFSLTIIYNEMILSKLPKLVRRCLKN